MKKGTAGFAVAVASTASVLLFASPHASAAVTIGSPLTDVPAGNLTFSGTFVQSELPGQTLTSPIDGVVVRWRVRTGSPAPSTVAFRIVRPLGGDTYTGAGSSAAVAPAANAINVFSERLPIKAGEHIGLDRPSTSGMIFGATSGAEQLRFTPALADGGPPRSPSAINLAYELLVNADIEPDADADGFGDETQDQCPTDASSQLECVPPETTITKGPKDKTKRKRASFEFVSDEPGSTFECRLDGGPYEPCASPRTYKVKKGRHVFDVRATDPIGNLDPVPATDTWKVRKKRR